MHCGLQLVASLQACEVHAVNFGAGEQARLLTAVLGSVMAQEQANSIAEGSAVAQQGLHGPHHTVKKKACNAHQIWCAMFVPTGTPYMA